MEFLRFVINVLFILAMILVVALPFALEFITFRRDKVKKITYKRFRIVVYSAVYIIGITLALYLLKEIILWLETLSFIQWIVNQLALSNRIVYFGKVLVAILVNFAIGLLYIFFSKFVRIGLQKKNLVIPKKKNGEFNLRQKAERKVIRFFHTETWFFVGSILKYLSIILTAVYAVVFITYQIPAMFGADWIPYGFISMLFSAGYIYPTISLLGLWEMFFFLEGIKLLENECPELLYDDPVETKKIKIDLNAIDEAVRKEFKDYFVCDVDVSSVVNEDIASATHNPLTELIAQAVEKDKRNPRLRKEAYLNCMDKLVDEEKGLLINGNFFSEFSMYFLRYLSSIIARGDNVVFVCNTDAQIDSVYDYIVQGLSEISSLFCMDFQKDAIDFVYPIWRVIMVSGEHAVPEDASVDDNNILVTSLSYLCSSRLENEKTDFIALIDSVILVDTLNTVNKSNRQLARLNTRLKHITQKNLLNGKNSKPDDMFKMRYLSRQIRYICFDDTRTPGLDKVLKNMLSVDFVTSDAMKYNLATVVRCYSYEGKSNGSGRRVCPQFFNTDEEIGAVMNMAVLCLAKGASNVTVFADDLIPYENISETISSNMAQVSVEVNGTNIRLNKHFYNPDDYSVIIAMDTGDNLPATLRRYVSMVSYKPALIIIFSRPYMMRDFYTGNIDKIWSKYQLERIPVEKGTEKDIAQKILVKADAGGISKKEIIRLVTGVPLYDEYVAKNDIDGILRGVLQVYGISQEERLNLFTYFEYTLSKKFDENGMYNSDVNIVLQRQGKLFELINGRDMIVMINGDDNTEFVLPIPRSRLTQNYIAGQNMLHNGNIYHIQKIDTASGHIYTNLAVDGKNDEVYRYVQAREYYLEINPEQVEYAFIKRMVLNKAEEDISVSDVFVSAFRVPMEAVTKGYFEVDPHTLAENTSGDYYSISDDGDDILSKQTYRRYGNVLSPYYSSDQILECTYLNACEKGASVMAIRICGEFGSDINKTMALAAVMLNELLRTMFPSVADSIIVGAVFHGEFTEEKSQAALQKLPKLVFTGTNDLISSTDFELVIIEDCSVDLGVISVLMSAGVSIIKTLFEPIFKYLEWYFNAKDKSDYLYYGLDYEPTCFSFDSLHKLSIILGDGKYDNRFIDIKTVLEYESCDFCGKRYSKGDSIVELEDSRKMCKSCAKSIVGNSRKDIKSHLDRARMYLESIYGIKLDDDYEFCFDSTASILNTLKKNSGFKKRDADFPLKSYIDDKKKVHVEYSIPSINLSELLVRELTHVWQLKHLPDVAEDLAEGHIALVAIQYLRFLNQNSLAAVRTNYYESKINTAGDGYCKLVRALLNNPWFHNNPFRYLLETTGGSAEEAIIPPTPRILETGDYGLAYTPESSDRVLDGNIPYFYRSRLTASCQKVYDMLVDAIKNHIDKVVVEGCTFKDVEKAVNTIRYDRPELFWFKTFSMCGTEVRLIYCASAEETEVLQRRIDEVVPKYLEGIEDSMSAYDVAIRLHLKVIASVDYDSIGLKQQEREGGPTDDKIDYLRTICGVFLNGKAVCEGYARGMQYLLQKCGIECAEAVGYIRKDTGKRGEPHAWNILKIDGDYYYLDTTWDDSSNTVQTVKTNDFGYNYFCITTAELTRTREVDLCPTEVPNCDATRGNYHYHNGFVLETYDLDKIKSIAQTAAERKCKSFTFKCKSNALFEQALSQMCSSGVDCYDALKAAAKIDRQILTSTYSYTYDRHIWTITVNFKYK